MNALAELRLYDPWECDEEEPVTHDSRDLGAADDILWLTEQAEFLGHGWVILKC